MNKVLKNKMLKQFLVLLGAMFFVAAVLLTASILGEQNGVPSIGGLGYLSVQSDSMNPVFKEGDLIVVKTTSPTDTFKRDDIVTFNAIIDGQRVLNTHRIVEIEEIAGTLYYTTSGQDMPNDSNTIISGDIVAIYSGVNLKKIGFAMDYIQSKTGFFIFVVAPLMLLLVYQLYRFIIVFSNSSFQNNEIIDRIDLSKLTDEEKKTLDNYIKKRNSSSIKG